MHYQSLPGRQCAAVFIHCCHSDMPRDLVPPAVQRRLWHNHLLATARPCEPKGPPKGQLDLASTRRLPKHGNGGVHKCGMQKFMAHVLGENQWKNDDQTQNSSKQWDIFNGGVRPGQWNCPYLPCWMRLLQVDNPTLIRHQDSFCRFCATSSRSCHSAFCFLTSSCVGIKSPTLLLWSKETPKHIMESTWFWREPLNGGKCVISH